MTEKMNVSDGVKQMSRRGSMVAGFALVAIGVLIGLNNFFELPSFGNLFMLFLSAIFLVWALAAREGGLLIPAGILGGIGVGVLLIGGPYAGAVEETQGGAFLLAFAGGWGAITLLSLLLRPVQWWPLIPGAILGAIGAALLIGGPALEVLAVVGKWWPLALVLVGGWIILKRR